MGPRAGGATAIGIALLTGALIWQSTACSGDDRPAPSGTVHTSAAESTRYAPPPPPAVVERVEGQPALQPREGERIAQAPLEQTANRVLELRLLGDAAHDPQRAQATWTPLDNDVLGHFATREATLDLFRLEDRHRRIEQRSSRAFGTADGRLEISAPATIAGAEQGSVVWITHPRGLPVALQLEPGAQSWAAGAMVELPPAAPSWIEVRRSDGTPAAGARVRQQALLGRDFAAPAGTAELLCRALARESETDATGRAELVPMEGPQELHVALGGQSARLVAAEAPRGEVLTLGPTFSVAGRVEARQPVGPWATVRVEVLGPQGHGPKPLAALAVDGQGRFGPLELPFAADALAYRLVLTNAAAFAPPIHVPAPRAGEQLELVFLAEPSLAFWLWVTDAHSGAEIPGAFVRLLGEAEGRRFEQVSTGSGHLEFTGVPAGRYRIELDAPELAPRRYASMAVDAGWNGQVVQFELSAPGRIVGRVFSGGGPATHFRVRAVPPGGTSVAIEAEFRSADGRFELENLDPAPYRVHALLPGQRTSAVGEIRVAAGETHTMEFHEQATATVVGMVVEAGTGRPLEGVEIATRLVAGGHAVETLEDGWRSGPDGSFAVEGIPVRGAVLAFEREGHLTEVRRLGELVPGGVSDLGAVALERASPLDWRLVGAAPGDAQRYSLRWGGAVDQATGFDREGRARVPGARVGAEFALEHPDGTRDAFWPSAERLAGPDFELQIVPGRIRLGSSASGRDDGDLRVQGSLSWQDAGGSAHRRSLSGDLAAGLEIPGLPAREGHLHLVSSDGRAALYRVLRLAQDGGGDFALDLIDPPLSVLVRGQDGEPVSGALVDLERVGSFRWGASQSALTAADGRVRFAKPAEGTAYVWVLGPQGERIVQREATFGPDQHEWTVELDSLQPMLVRVHADQRPVPGARVMLRPVRGEAVFATAWSDASGLARFGPLGPDPVLLEAYKPGHWQRSVALAPGRAGAEQLVELPLLADLELSFRDPSGRLLGGVDWSLRRLESLAVAAPPAPAPADGCVSAWLAQGRVRLEVPGPGSVATLSLRGLPAGRYALEAEHASGGLNDEFDLPAGTMRRTLVLQ